MNLRYRKPNTVKVAFLLALLAMWGIATTASAQNRTFAPTILSEAGCTVTVNAGQSIGAAVNGATSGAVICVRGGVYNEQLKMTPTHSGKSVRAYPGETPILDGTGLTLETRFVGLVHITGSNITVEGFEVRDSPGRGVVVTQGGLPQATSNVTIRNMIVHDNWDSGINVNGTETVHPINILIEGNEVYDNLVKNTNNVDEGGSGLVFTETRDSVARGNTVYHNLGEGLVAGRFSTNLLLEGNVTYDNDHANLYLVNAVQPIVKGNFVFCTDDRFYWKPYVWKGDTYYKAGKGIQLRSESFDARENQPPPGSGEIIINNVVAGCGANFDVATQIPGGGLVDAIVANNTFVNARGDVGPGVNNVLFEKNLTYSNSKFVNNLMIQTTPGENVRVQYSTPVPSMATLTVANNLYWPSSAAGWDWFSGEQGRVVQDPRLVNLALPTKTGLADPGWYAIQSNSPAINAGRAVAQVTDDFVGAARTGALDIGAFEYTSGVSTGTIRVALAVGSGSGAPQASFASSFPPESFQVAPGSTFQSDPLQSGMYDVAMTPIDGWTQTSATCSDGSSPLAINLGSGETVTCTFTIAEEVQTGTIIVAKTTVPSGTTQPFSFTTSFDGGFDLSDGQSHTAAGLAAGTYSVAETLPSGWSSTSATCSDGSSPASIGLVAGETVTCTFVSTQLPTTGTIIVAKETDPNHAADQFTFTTNYNSGFVLADGETSTSNPLNPGTYSVTEAALDGWEATGATCSDGSAPSAINLVAGETVTCTFNSRQNTPTEPGETIYVAAKQAGSVDGITFGMEDVLAYDVASGQWSLYLDMSRLGLIKGIDAFTFLDDGSVLISFSRTQGIDGLGLATAQDIVRFIPTGTGAATAGTFEWYLQGVDVGLTTAGEAIDAMTIAPDGRLVISTAGNAIVGKLGGTNLKARDEDLIVFNATQLGENAAGTWEMFLSGTAVSGLRAEDINGVWIDPANDDIYLNLYAGFNLGGVRGNSRHIVRLRPSSDGYEVSLHWFGPDTGFSGVPDAFTIAR